MALYMIPRLRRESGLLQPLAWIRLTTDESSLLAADDENPLSSSTSVLRKSMTDRTDSKHHGR